MQINQESNSVVIVAASHNPSVISNAFLTETKLIPDFAAIDERKLLITPALSQIVFNNQTTLQLDPERLSITTIGDSDYAAQLGDQYCKTLPYIKGTAIGINSTVNIKDFDFANWFTKMKSIDFRGGTFFSIDIQFKVDDSICFTKVSMTAHDKGTVTFNYHQDLIGVTLGKINSIVTLKAKYATISDEFLKYIFK